MLFIGIPSYNEATTIGVLLWRLRSVLADVSREYEVVVYDDASTDETAAVLEPYTRVLPLTVLRGQKRVGTGGAVDAIVRHVARTTRYPRRDGLLLMQGDFTDSPALVPEFLRRFEGGADLIIGERASAADAPVPVRRLYAASRWVLRPFVGISDVRDLTSSFRLARISVLRDLLKAAGDTPVALGDAWMAQADFLLRAAPHARRVETIPVTPSFGVRTRETRRTAWPDTLALAKWGWRHRGQRIDAKVIARTVEAPVDAPELVEVTEPERPERPERRERVAEPMEKRGRRERGGERRDREDRSESSGEGRTETRERTARPPRPPRSRRSTAPDGAMPAGVAEEAASDERSGEGSATLESAETERSGRKRRRGKRGTKRSGEMVGGLATDGSLSETSGSETLPPAPAGADGESGATRAGASADRTDDAAEGMAGDVNAEAIGEGSEPRRRRARRGRRRRGEGRGAEEATGERSDDGREATAGRDASSRESEGRESDGRESEGRESEGRDFERRESEGRDSEGRETEGGEMEGGEPEGAQRRRNRRGRRGGRRRSGSAEGRSGEGGSGAEGASGDAGGAASGPSEPPPLS